MTKPIAMVTMFTLLTASPALAQANDGSILAAAVVWVKQSEGFGPSTIVDQDRIGRRDHQTRTTTPLAPQEMIRFGKEAGVVVAPRSDVLICETNSIRTCKMRGESALVTAQIIDEDERSATVSLNWYKPMQPPMYPESGGVVLLLKNDGTRWTVAQPLQRIQR